MIASSFEAMWPSDRTSTNN